MAKTKQLDKSGFLHGLAEGLRSAAKAPNIYGYKPHKKQEFFHKSGARGKQFIGGNRSGKTVGGAVEAIWWLTGKHPYRKTPEFPVRGRCVSVDFINGVEKIVRPEIAKWMPNSELKGGSWHTAYNKELRTLTLENGSFLEFMSYDQDLEKFAGTSRHFTWFDEEPPQAIFQECRMRLLDVGGSWWITMTPVEGMTWTYDDIYLESRQNPNLEVFQVNTFDNIYLNQAEIEATMVGMSKEDIEARVHGKYIQRTGLIYKHFGEEHIIEPFLPKKEWLHVAALDHGFNNPTAWLWAAVDPDGNIFVYDEHYESGRIVSYHAGVVLQKNRDHGREPTYYVGDPSIRNVDPLTGTSIQIEYIEYGVPVLLGNNDVQAGIQRVARYFGEPPFDGPKKPKLYIMKNCEKLLWELDRYRWGRWVHKTVATERNKKEEPMKKDDHAVDALRYLIASRPEVDSGSEVPDQALPVDEINRKLEISTAVSMKTPRVDESLTTTSDSRYAHVDFTLGGDW